MATEPHTTNPPDDDLVRLADEAGATFTRDIAGRWFAYDQDGITIVRGALSKAEAARLFVEEIGPPPPEAEPAPTSPVNWLRRLMRGGAALLALALVAGGVGHAQPAGHDVVPSLDAECAHPSAWFDGIRRTPKFEDLPPGAEAMQQDYYARRWRYCWAAAPADRKPPVKEAR